MRPEDIEKITTTFLSKNEIQGYSRFVSISEIADERNDYTLNIRRYVDNTPSPEPQDVKAHLVGGVPNNEIDEITDVQGAKFSFTPSSIVKARFNDPYSDFVVNNRNDIKGVVENDIHVKDTTNRMNSALEGWWYEGREVFATLAGNQTAELPKVRAQLLNSINSHLTPLNILDKFQVSGIFVRWWDGIKYDLKTIRQRSWDIDLVNNEDFRYLIIDKYFQEEQEQIDNLRIQLGRLESDLSTLVEEALELCEYEPEDNEDGKETKITPKLAKDQIAVSIEVLDETEAKPYNDKMAEILSKESAIKQAKAQLQNAEEMLNVCVRLKCYGEEDELSPLVEKRNAAQQQLDCLDDDSSLHIASIADRLSDISTLDSISKSISTLERQTKANEKKMPTVEGKQLLVTITSIKASLKDIKKQNKALHEVLSIIDARICAIHSLFSKMGGQVTEDECREMILRKHHIIISTEMSHYLGSEQRSLITSFERLYDKYAVSAKQIAEARDSALKSLNDALVALQYID